MLIFKNRKNENPFGFEDKNYIFTGEENIQSRVFEGATPVSTTRSSKKKKLTKNNIKFLELLGLKVKKH